MCLESVLQEVMSLRASDPSDGITTDQYVWTLARPRDLKSTELKLTP